MDEDCRVLKRLHDSANKTIKRLEVENTVLKKKLEALEAQKNQWETDRSFQQMVIQRVLDEANESNNRYRQEIEDLRKRMKNGYIN
jgi:septal ring factor EnvC (AmiA/AmiB activator)